jgi:membrane-bound serine protease (ClpP class)
MWRIKAAIALVAALLIACAAAGTARAQDGRVFLTDLDGAIGVAAQRQIARAIETAARERGAALIVRLDTPGGLVSATREILKDIIAAPLPIVVYVAPSGARAASAGTFIVYAAHVAAMAPGTNLGAATPVSIGGLPGLPGQPSDSKKKDSNQTAMERKAINDVVALLRSLAQLRGRNVDFAEKAVREAATMTADDAAKEGVVDTVAASLEELLTRIDGRTVKIGSEERTLKTKGAEIVAIETDLRTRVLSIISDPNIAFILLMIGFYGVILEFWNPGTFVPGVIGAICLILALVSLSTLPVHYGALALLVLGIGLMIAEAFTPGIGILGIGGVIAFIAGAYFLFEGAEADFTVRVSLPVILGSTATTAALIFGLVGAAMRARRRPPATGAEEMIGSRGSVVEWHGTSGAVRAHGEVWSARAERTLKTGDAVRVVGREGMTLIVEP